MNKAQLVERVHTSVEGLNKKQATEVVSALIGAITDGLSEGNTVTISGFGKFTVRDRAARDGRNPKTGERIKIAAHKVVHFAPATLLKKTVN
jgi:DNA-binding protein HU-beta